MLSLLLAVASFYAVGHCTILHPLPPFLPSLVPLSGPLPGPDILRHHPLLLPGHPDPHPRKILIIRPPPDALLPPQHLNPGLHPLPLLPLPRRPRLRPRLRLRRPPLLERRYSSRDLGAPPPHVAKYGYGRPIFNDGDRNLDRRLGSLRDRDLRPFGRQFRGWSRTPPSGYDDTYRDRPRSFRRRGYRFDSEFSTDFGADARRTDYRDRFSRDYSSRSRDIGDLLSRPLLGESRLSDIRASTRRDNRREYSREFVGKSRTFESQGAVRRPIFGQTDSNLGGHRNAINTGRVDLRRASVSRRPLGKISPRSSSRRSRGQQRKEIPRKPVTKTVVGKMSGNIRRNLNSRTQTRSSSGTVVDLTRPAGGLLPLHESFDGVNSALNDVLDLSHVQIPNSDVNFRNSQRSESRLNTVLDLTTFEGPNRQQKSTVVQVQDADNVKIVKPVGPNMATNVKTTDSKRRSSLKGKTKAKKALKKAKMAPSKAKKVSKKVVKAPLKAKKSPKKVVKPPGVKPPPKAKKPPVAKVQKPAKKLKASSKVKSPPSVNIDLAPKVVVQPAPVVAPVVEPPKPKKEAPTPDLANLLGAAHTLDTNPLSSSGGVSIVDLHSTGSSAILPGAELGSFGNVDVLTLSNEGYAQLEHVIQSGKTLSPDELGRIIAKNSGSGSASTKKTVTGAEIVVIDHPTAGHVTGRHSGTAVRGGLPTAGHKHSVESLIPPIAQATNVLTASNTAHTVTKGKASLHHTHHGTRKAVEAAVGVVGDPVGIVEAQGATDIVGLFSMPSGSKFPNVDKSVSSIPSSIGKLLNGVNTHHPTHVTH